MDPKPDKEKTPNDREALLMSLYQDAFPLVASHVKKMGGSFDEAKDIFQDALIIYYEKVQHTGKTLQCTEKAYLFGIAKFLWNKRYKVTSKQFSLDLNNDLDAVDSVYEEISLSRLIHLLQTAGQKCMQLLSAFYYERLNMESLAERFGFSGPRSATVQKFKCLEKIKETVKEKSLNYEDIME
ncbi:RNA polymerase sigma factor [Pedobacter cryoconitis]|uniref:DNA-directed RNA polymerase specialized sigma24 family protein n=1 Tax=Pedobacter cryoconitis TaxID=188932 RepID=A0A7X0J7N0_9SPHI|nr:sigma-70 family RNA polymerase sigma factor [Pedobacter cryoconitis]MBB6502604.1 DNA-directed RNA polymerase specialized sigma24 family protein [Pedobacter cryoconitis]